MKCNTFKIGHMKEIKKLNNLKDEFNSIKNMSFEEYLDSKYIDAQIERNEREYLAKRLVKRDSIIDTIACIIGIIIAVNLPSIPSDFVNPILGTIIATILFVGGIFLVIYSIFHSSFKEYLEILDETEEYENLNKLFEEKYNKEDNNER